jgi:hypothetical protein
MSFTHALMGNAIEEIRNFLECGGGNLSGDYQVGCSGFGGRGFDTSSYLLLWLPSSQLSGCCKFRFGYVRPGRIHGGGNFRLLGHLLYRLRKG